MKDSWVAGDTYEHFMGRWSRRVAERFLSWLSPSSGLQWLDVGCGSGALSDCILSHCAPAGLTAIDQSEEFVEALQSRLGSLAKCRAGNATALPLPDATMDMTVSGLVLNFITEQKQAVAEMMRVTKSDGIVAVYIWDYTGRMDFLKVFWDAAVELDPNVSALHEANRFPDSTPEKLKALFEESGLEEVQTASIEIDTVFRDFDDFWSPFLGGQGPAPSYVMSLDDTKRSKLRSILRERLPIQSDGSISMMARAWATRGRIGVSRPPAS